MSVNGILSNSSFLPHNLSSNSSSTGNIVSCFISRPGSIIVTAYNVTNILLLLPLYIFILYHGLQQCKQMHSSSSLTISHSDCITYHTVIMELIGGVGCILNCFAIYKLDINILIASFSHFNINWFGQIFFHTLTCVERYLAVVHPITYLSMKNEKGARIRNASIACVWLLCFAGMGSSFSGKAFIIINLCLLIFTLIIVSFCSVAVLCVLIGPGPGDQVEGKERTDQLKKRAFYIIMVILGALVLRLSFGLYRALLHVSDEDSHCLLSILQFWLNTPSSLILPFLFLQRAGKLGFLRRNQSPG